MAPTHEVATKLPSRFATFKVMFASAMTPEARLAVLKQYVVHPDVIQAAYAFFCSSNKHHRSYRAAMDAVQHQRLVEQQQQQPDGTTGVLAAAVVEAPTSAAPNGDTSAQQACEYLSTACAVDGVAVPGSMDVAPDAPGPVGVALHEHFSIAIPRATQAEQHEAIVGLFNDSPAHISPDVSAAAAAAAMADGIAVTGATDDDTNAAVAPPALQRAAVDGQPMATGDVQPRAEVGPGGDVLRIQTGSKPVALNDRRLLSMLFPVLFPWGHGGPDDTRPVEVSLHSCLQRYLCLSTTQFAEHPTFALVAYHLVCCAEMATSAYVSASVPVGNEGASQGSMWTRLSADQIRLAVYHLEEQRRAAHENRPMRAPPNMDAATCECGLRSVDTAPGLPSVAVSPSSLVCTR